MHQIKCIGFQQNFKNTFFATQIDFVELLLKDAKTIHIYVIRSQCYIQLCNAMFNYE